MKWLKKICILTAVPIVLTLSACGNSDPSHVSSWKSASLLTDSAWYPQIGVDGNGNVFSVWAQSTGFYANRYTVNSGWGIPQKIGESTTGWTDLQFAVGKSGHAVATWVHLELGDSYVQAVRYVPGTGWGTPEILRGIGTPKDITITESGSIYLATERYSVLSTGISIIRYDQASGWKDDQLGYTDTVTYYGFPRVSIDQSEKGFALWLEGNSGINKVYVSQRTQAGWGVPQVIASIAGFPEEWTNIAVDNNGNAMALWGQQDSLFTSHTYACRYTTTNGWRAAEQIDNSIFDSIDQSLAIDSYGNYYAVWSQRTDAGFSNIYSCLYSPVSGWQTPLLVGTNGIARHPQIAADIFGNVFTAWQQYDPNDPFPGDANIYSNQYTTASGWGMQQQLKRALGGADSPGLVVDPFGNATVMWSQSTGSVGGSITYGIFYCRFE